MCGFAGYWTSSSAGVTPAGVLAAMTQCIVHRGPDDAGEWYEQAAEVGLGFRRLAILDLTPAGHQPMTSASGRYVVIFNGEIYNFAALREELSAVGCVFRGHSDTEILLAAVERWGVVEAIRRCVGMFAIALWDREQRTLHLVRDRFGEKPLYYGVMRGALLFGSELKALQAHPAWAGEIDRGAVSLFLRHNYVPAPYTIYRDVRKVVPGTIVTFQDGRFESPSVTTYWSALDMVQQSAADPMQGSDEEMIDQLDATLRRTIREEMIADVPLGAFLSGGVDSSALVALMQAQSSAPVRTFTIGFNEVGYNEATYAKAVAAHLGTDHTELYVTPEEARAVIPRLPTIYDEPFADSSQIPTFLVAQLARRHVTVSLSGEGGDELFAGYNRYFWGERLWRRLQPIPRAIRGALGRSLRTVPPHRWDTIIGTATSVMPKRYRVVTPGHKVHKTAAFLGADSPDEMYRTVMTHWPDPAAVTGTAEPRTILTSSDAWPGFDDVVQRMMYFDMVTELPDDILVKVDRATMAVSLESRAPFLDHRVAEFAWRIPMHQKIRHGQGKWLLRQLLYRYVPKTLIERPKMGFGVPIDSWLRGPLREWAEELIAPSRLEREGFFAPAAISTAWHEHQTGQRNNAHLLWGVLMFQGWLATTQR
ncbi:MAG TPA: asparagine synthase (glutamine-hydrolyzing) [Gemmatimonadaceae bacterium]|jgi:asparagine synthase (glutamine-hydrolysing)|nr:asparagine synthase (glutamine-hydrolyzing) [Gemmatimonadaceae bacterium]